MYSSFFMERGEGKYLVTLQFPCQFLFTGSHHKDQIIVLNIGFINYSIDIFITYKPGNPLKIINTVKMLFELF